MVSGQPQPTYRKDYKPTPYLVDKLNLTFLLDEEATTVRSRLHFVPNPAAASNGAPELSLDGAPFLHRPAKAALCSPELAHWHSRLDP